MNETRSPLNLREPQNVRDVMQNDGFVRRLRVIRKEVVQMKTDMEHWNDANPDEEPMSTDWEDRMIAWCDGKGPMPEKL